MDIDIPREWTQIDFNKLSGTLMVIGGTDVGKSTFARYLYSHLAGRGSKVAFIDGDPGQSNLGPPGTMTAATEIDFDLAGNYNKKILQANRCWRSFVGAVTPSGHMLPVLTGCHRLMEAVRFHGAAAVVYDTCGLVDPIMGGHSLKLAKIDLLRPEYVIAIQREDELGKLLQPLMRSRRTQVIVLRPSSSVIRRSPDERQSHRAEKFRQYFSSSRTLSILWSEMAIFPYPRFILNRLLAFEDVNGYTLALGIIIGIDRVKKNLDILTPLEEDQNLNAIHLGDVRVDPVSFRDEAI